jgi:hypothetical protein
MNKTIMVSIGIIISVITMMMIIRTSYDIGSKQIQKVGISNIVHNTYVKEGNNMLLLSWRTNKDSDGLIILINDSDTKKIISDSIGKYHRLDINMNEMSNILKFNITSCDLTNMCETKEGTINAGN